MKKLIIVLALFFTVTAFAQQSGTMYVAAKSGLTLRDGPGTEFRATNSIPYGTQLNILQSEEELKSHVIENMRGYWQKVKYNNKTGYILDSYLLPWPPPKAGSVNDMKQYIAQVTAPFGNKLTVKSLSSGSFDEMGWELNKQLYKNGAEWHQNFGHEYGTDVYFLPGFTIQQGFLLLRLIPEFSNAIKEDDAMPIADKTIKRGEYEEDFKIMVDKEDFGDGYSWYKKIKYEYADGAYYELEIYRIDNQLVISFGGGV